MHGALGFSVAQHKTESADQGSRDSGHQALYPFTSLLNIYNIRPRGSGCQLAGNSHDPNLAASVYQVRVDVNST